MLFNNIGLYSIYQLRLKGTDISKDKMKNATSYSNKTIFFYLKIARLFLKTNPDIYNIADYNDFLIKNVAKKERRCSNYYYAIKKFIQLMVEDVPTRNKLIKQLIKPQIRDPKTLINKVRLSKSKRLEVLLNLSSLRHQIMALIQFHTGMRIGDVINIQVGNIKEEDYEIIENGAVKHVKCLRITTISKGDKHTTKYIFDKDTITYLKEYIDNFDEVYNEKKSLPFRRMKPWESYYFLKLVYKVDDRKLENTKDYTYEKYRIDLKFALNASNVDYSRFSSHDFRRCFADEVYENYDKDIILTQKMLGHSRVETTVRYLRTSGLDTKDVYRQMQTSN